MTLIFLRPRYCYLVFIQQYPFMSFILLRNRLSFGCRCAALYNMISRIRLPTSLRSLGHMFCNRHMCRNLLLTQRLFAVWTLPNWCRFSHLCHW